VFPGAGSFFEPARFDFAVRVAKIQPAKKTEQKGRSPSGVATKRNPFINIAHGHDLAEAIVDAIREPLLVLDPDLP
jgi:hypothetical protein